MIAENLSWHPGRVLFGLSRIGYTPHSAIADIVDNSVTYGADNVHILIEKQNAELADSRKNNIKQYVVVDDGIGMDRQGMLKALGLGLDDQDYDAESLSKFGLGLKSASFSQGNLLQVVSGNAGHFLKFSVDMSQISDSYFCVQEEIDEADKALIDAHLSDGHGTIVRILDIHENNHPSIKTTLDQLHYRLGTIYYYFLSGGLVLTLNSVAVEPYDVLFTSEADGHDNLNEHEWNGRHVAWIKKPSSQTLDIDSDPPVSAVVEVTQLPHPPTFDLDGEGERKKIRERYKIESRNYGYYVYRNRRLISWAERFDGIVPQDQDFYAFRGRILLDTSADDSFNIDVKKSHLTLSDEAHNALSDLSDEYKRKSKIAWQNANALKKRMLGEEPNTIANDIAQDLDLPDIAPGETPLPPEEEQEKQEREALARERIRKSIKDEAKRHKVEELGDESAPTEEEIWEYATGGGGHQKHIFRVPTIMDNLLWEPYYDDDNGWCVRINQNHRFARCIFEDNDSNTDLQVIFELLLLEFVHAEAALLRKTDLEQGVIQECLLRYRETVSGLLVGMMRNRDIQLPPLD